MKRKAYAKTLGALRTYSFRAPKAIESVGEALLLADDELRETLNGIIEESLTDFSYIDTYYPEVKGVIITKKVNAKIFYRWVHQ